MGVNFVRVVEDSVSAAALALFWDAQKQAEWCSTFGISRKATIRNTQTDGVDIFNPQN
jgi:hypothetical protein